MECKCKDTEIGNANKLRFNRYIVECKYKVWNQFQVFSDRFNRYIVECKYNGTCEYTEHGNDLIDT